MRPTGRLAPRVTSTLAALATAALALAPAPPARADDPPGGPVKLRPLPRPGTNAQPVLTGLVRPKFEVRTHVTVDRSAPAGQLPKLQRSRVGQVLSERKLLTTLADGLSQKVNLARPVAIISQPCGQSNAFYDPDTGNITLCDELFVELEQLFSHMGAGPAFEEAVLGATVFFVLHEVGHALVHQFGIPLLAREEDAVDGIATYLVLTSGIPNVAFSGANAFAFMGARRQSGAQLAFWDEHSIHEQRFYNISCWIYGSAPSAYGFLVQTNMLPQKRANRCPAEWRQLGDGVVKLLGPHLAGGR